MEKFSFIDKEGVKISYYKWELATKEPVGVVQIVHGMTEYAARYDYFAKRLCENGYIVYAHDHRGHGDSLIEGIKGYIGEKNGFEMLVDDVKELTDIIKKENPSLPLVVFGHSMGSFVTQRYMQEYGREAAGIILSGTNGKPQAYTKAGILVSRIEMIIKGNKAICPLMDKLSFGSFNANFKPTRTEFDWLCSDENEVDKYIADEKCGFVCTTSFYNELVKATWRIHEKENMNKIPKDMPIYIMAGDKDPVGNSGKGIIDLYNRYKALQIKNVQYKLYKNGRHEMLNEKNKDEVIDDIVAWTNKLVEEKVQA